MKIAARATLLSHAEEIGKTLSLILQIFEYSSNHIFVYLVT